MIGVGDRRSEVRGWRTENREVRTLASATVREALCPCVFLSSYFRGWSQIGEELRETSKEVTIDDIQTEE